MEGYKDSRRSNCLYARLQPILWSNMQLSNLSIHTNLYILIKILLSSDFLTQIIDLFESLKMYV